MAALCVLVACLFVVVGSHGAAVVRGSDNDTLKTLALVNSHWQGLHPTPTDWSWETGTYHTGNLAHYRATHNESLLDYSLAWGEAKNWKLNKCDEIGDDECTVADNQCCGQSYAEMFLLKKDRAMLSFLYQELLFQAQHPCTDRSARDHLCWWWVDALFMALPTWARVANVTKDQVVFDAMWDLYLQNSQDPFRLWSEPDSLFFRDDTYLNKTTPSGKKVFWARGNGWAIAALTRALEYIPKSKTEVWADFSDKITKMAAKLKSIQGSDGCWRASLDDYNEFPNKESTGTGLFTFGLASAIRQGIIPASEYSSVAEKGWQCLTSNVQSDGLVGWCQPVGGSPTGAPTVNATSTNVFCVGQFLLAGSEVYLLQQEQQGQQQQLL